MKKVTGFLFGMLAGFLLVPAAYVGLLVALDHMERLKAPTFSNRASLDEKLRFVRKRDAPPVDLLLLGSSTTLWGVDGEHLLAQLPERTALNAGVRDLKIHQAADLFELHHKLAPAINDVVMISTLLDFESCAPGSARLVDHPTAMAYASGQASELESQLRALDPAGVLRSAARVAGLRHDPPQSPDSLHFDVTGSIQLDLPREAVPDMVWRGSLPPFDERCYASLVDLAARVAAAGARFIFVQAPLRPGYLVALDPTGERLLAHRRRLASLAADAGFVLADAHDDLDLPEASFFDAYHLRAPFTVRLTDYVVTQLKKRMETIEDKT